MKDDGVRGHVRCDGCDWTSQRAYTWEGSNRARDRHLYSWRHAGLMRWIEAKS